MNPSRRSEIGWWSAIGIWILAVVFWRPEPSGSFLEAPSNSTWPSDYGIFHDLVAEQTEGTLRLFGSLQSLSDDVGVMVLLSPQEPVPLEDRNEIVEWVVGTGGTLILGFPIWGEDKTRLDGFFNDYEYMGTVETDVAAPGSQLSYVSEYLEVPREVPAFRHTVVAVLNTEDYPVLMDEQQRVVVSAERYGMGRVIQLAMSDLLDNRSIGEKQTHLFAAALIDEAGRETKWVFNEAYENITPEPAYLKLVGASQWRPVFLQIVLLALLGYWRYSRRLGTPKQYEPANPVRDVATQARDTGEFYLRAGKSRWALACSLDALKLALKDRRVTKENRSVADQIAGQVKTVLRVGDNNLERDVDLMKKIAECQQGLASKQKGKV